MYPNFFATGNEDKIREVRAILGYAVQQVSIDLFEPQGIKVEEVVRKKAEDAFQQIGKPVLVEDTGLEFAAWNGLPGALMKWFLDTVGNEGILKMLSGEADRVAVAKTVVGFFDGDAVHFFVGKVHGTISETVRGVGGFGWDPLFVPDGYDKSFAEMTQSEKNAVSMRRIALEQMKSCFSCGGKD
ncbi:MAG: RdgB/HAM1 family non-canonical purine NTP pyrophosphatase [Candidatus Kaiserbacteria bacterium]|nr:RdgB/HAM1 family non-canonical purine NTP pyrophosphatase [Candidatus Kaiserbacteria bacterium]